MSQAVDDREKSRIALVVGLDLSHVSEHLLVTARDLVRSVDEAELHLVHVVRRESVTQRLAEPTRSPGTIERASAEVARCELERLRDSIGLGPRVRVTLHTPVGHAAEEIARIAKIAPCSVLAVRRRSTARPETNRAEFAACRGQDAGEAQMRHGA